MGTAYRLIGCCSWFGNDQQMRIYSFLVNIERRSDVLSAVARLTSKSASDDHSVD